MARKKEVSNVHYLEDYRHRLSVPAECTMKDCKFFGHVSLGGVKAIDRVHCPKCVNQSLKLVYPK